MPGLLDQLIQDHGDEIAVKISRALGVSREEADRVLSAAAPVILNRFEGGEAGGGPVNPEAEHLDSLLDGTGDQMKARIQGVLGVSPEQAAKVVPLVVPVVLRFLMRRVPYGGAAVPMLASWLHKQGGGSFDDLAQRLAAKCRPSPGSPSIPALLGRFAGKYFPREK